MSVELEPSILTHDSRQEQQGCLSRLAHEYEQRAMNGLLGGVKWSYVTTYLQAAACSCKRQSLIACARILLLCTTLFLHSRPEQ